MKKSWVKNYKLLGEYYLKYGNVNIPKNFIVYRPNLEKLKFIQRQKSKNDGAFLILNKLILLIVTTNMIFDLHDAAWNQYYRLLKQYYDKYEPIEIDIQKIKLGLWLQHQRAAYKGTTNFKINQEQINLLNQYHIKWDVRKDKWNQYYHLLKKYFEEHGNIDVPQLYVMDNWDLGIWLDKQRKSYRKVGTYRITQEQIMLLNNLDMNWSPKTTKILNKKIDSNNYENYNELLLDRINHIIDDLVYEGINDIDLTNQDEIKKIMIKRIWR